MSEYVEKFKQILLDNYDKNMKLPWGERNICDPPTDAQLALYCLCDTFLGENWCIGMPETQAQVNTAILFRILYNYNRNFRRWCKVRKKNNKKPTYIYKPSCRGCLYENQSPCVYNLACGSNKSLYVEKD